MYSDGQLRVLMGSAVVAVVSGILGVLAWHHQPMAPDGDPVLGAPQLVLLETDDCTWCDDFQHTTARAFADTPTGASITIHYISVEDGPPPRRYRLTAFDKAPMLVLFDQYGRELDRMAYPPADSAAVEKLVKRNMYRIAKT